MFPLSPLCCFAKNRHFGHFYRIYYFSSNSSFFMGFLHSTNLQQFSFPSILIRLLQGLYVFFWPSKVCLKNRLFFKMFPLSPLCCFAKNRHFGHFYRIYYFSSNSSFFMGFLHSTNLQQFSFPSILIRLLQGLYVFFWPSKVCLKNRLFFKMFPLSPLCCFAKNRHFRHFYRIYYFSSNSSFFMGFLHSTNLQQFSFPSILIRLLQGLYVFFWPSKVCLKNRLFFKMFPLSPLCCFAKNHHFRHFNRNCYFSSISSFFMRFFAQHKTTIVQLSIHTIQAITGLVFPILFAIQSLPKKSTIFEKFPLVPSLLFCEKSQFSTILQKLLFLF